MDAYGTRVAVGGSWRSRLRPTFVFPARCLLPITEEICDNNWVDLHGCIRNFPLTGAPTPINQAGHTHVYMHVDRPKACRFYVDMDNSDTSWTHGFNRLPPQMWYVLLLVCSMLVPWLAHWAHNNRRIWKVHTPYPTFGELRALGKQANANI